ITSIFPLSIAFPSVWVLVVVLLFGLRFWPHLARSVMICFLTKAILWLPVAVNLIVLLAWVLLMTDTTKILVLALQMLFAILGVGFVRYYIHLTRRAWEIDRQYRSSFRHDKARGGPQVVGSIVFCMTIIFAVWGSWESIVGSAQAVNNAKVL